MPSFSIWGTDDEVASIKAAAAKMERSVSWYLMWCHKQLKDASRVEVKKPPEVSKPKKKRVPEQSSVLGYTKNRQLGKKEGEG